MKKHILRGLTTTQIIASGFLGAILIGMILLMLPIASKSGMWTDPVDALFASTTSVCVTGLTTLSTAGHWSLFGQIVIMVLVQFGGLGIVTFTTIILLIAGRRITLKERLLIKDAYNLDSLHGLVKLTMKILKGTLIIEGIGALLYMTVFVRDYHFSGIFTSIFNSVSAFCNAGLDVIGDTSLAVYKDNVIVNTVTMLLIIIGGIGFPVWWDILKARKIKGKKTPRKIWQKFELHTKLVLTVTFILVFGGALLIFALEYNNPDTMADLSFGTKVQSSFFQSVTTRTAGFYTIPQEQFTDASAFVSLLLMFIGGSPSGTAGGVKTITVAMIILTVVAIVKNREDTEVFGKSISSDNVRKGMAILILSLVVMIFSMGALSITQKSDFLDTIYECVSALATVGLSRGLTGHLDNVGKIIIILTMYIGRIGPISLALFFNTNKSNSKIKHYPQGKIHVG